MAEWLRRLTRKPKVRAAAGSNPELDSLVAVRNSSPGRPVPCEGNLVAAAGSCGGLMVKHPWPLLEISLSDFRRLATLNLIPTYLVLQKTTSKSRPVKAYGAFIIVDKNRPVGTKLILGGGLKRGASEASKNGGPAACPRENFS